ncbi:Phosphodiesterase [Fasciola gigantica]|uniref:Phosphodiesterase n=1 Tax=Fasciola gigantica TaxID=46835 RepID=A0A504YE18_FASGI|nr:Phosphodiesterase [Fasciola gigantica]
MIGVSGACVCQICGAVSEPDPEENFYDKITQWLDNNPTFTWSYFNRKADLPTDLWSGVESIGDSGSHAATGGDHKVLKEVETGLPYSRQHTNPSVPLRKISSQDFEFRDCKRIVSSCPDGSQTFIVDNPCFFDSSREGKVSVENREDITASTSSPRTSQSRRTFSLNERELINELVLDISHELDVTALCFKILQNVCILLNADRGSLFLIDKDSETGEPVLVSKLFDVTANCSLFESLEHSRKRHIKFPLGVGISGYVAQTGAYANIPDVYADPRFSDMVDRETGYRTRCLICMPIKNIHGKVLAVALIMNKKLGTGLLESSDKQQPDKTSTQPKENIFTERDVRIFESYVAFCGIGLHNAQIYQESRMEAYRNQVLLELARVIFTEQSDISRLIHTVLSHTIFLLRCQRCQMLLLQERPSVTDEPSSPTFQFTHCFDLACNDNLESMDVAKAMRSIEDSRFPVQLPIANAVLQTGEPINLADARSDPLFDSKLEEDLDSMWRTQTMLCMPIKQSDGQVLAVCFVMNKCSMDWRIEGEEEEEEEKDGEKKNNKHPERRVHHDRLQKRIAGKFIGPQLFQYTDPTDWSGRFSQADECLFEAFALFAGLGLANRQMYDRVVQLLARQRILLDVLSYHATAPRCEARRLANSLIPTIRFYHLDDFGFTDIRLSDEATLKASVRMFLEMRFMQSFKCDLLALCRWILSVKKNYRQVTYHNWRHALNVTQTMFAVIMKAELQGLFDDIECLALMVACLSHDLDHRGTDNQFQVKTMSPLAELYSTSVLEHHHFNQCMMLLSKRGNNFLSNLTVPDHRRVVRLIEEYILATDLSRYFARIPVFKRTLETRHESAQTGFMEPWSTNQTERTLLGCMLMTTCDISAITKPWPVQKLDRELVATEFFEQGDLEKNKLNTQPLALMDRSHIHELPQLQVNFIDAICLPIYTAIVKVHPALQPLLDGCQRNRECWSLLAEGNEIPEHLFGLAHLDLDPSPPGVSPSSSPTALRMGSIHATTARRIVNAKPFESTPARRTSTSTSTTVGGSKTDLR